jgi:MutS domain V
VYLFPVRLYNWQCPLLTFAPHLPPKGLTSKGFRVAVYEEGADTDASPGPGASASSKSRIKNRFLAQIVSPASPTYLYDLVLLSNADTLLAASPARPYVGIISLSSGYTVVEVDVEERTVRVSERLTAEAVACRLAAYPPVDPLLYVPSMREYESSRGTYSLPFIPNASQYDNGRRLRVQTIPPTLVEQPRPGLSESERARNTIVSALLKLTEIREDDDLAQRRVSLDSFTVISSANGIGDHDVTYTHPLTLETAKQLGLMEDRAIPSLVSHLVPDSAPSGTRRFLKRYLLTPPPPIVAQAMGMLVNQLMTQTRSVPSLTIPPVGKVLSLLRAGQASSQVYQELLAALKSTVTVIDMFGSDSDIIASLITVLEYETGMAASANFLKQRCLDAVDVIENVVAAETASSKSVERISNFGCVVPPSYFERNEASWRGRVRCEILNSYSEVERAASELAEAVASDFWGAASLSVAIDAAPESKTPIAQDIFNNAFALREVPNWCSEQKRDEFMHPRDRFGKLIRNRFITNAVQNALSDYLSACENATVEVSNTLKMLSRTLHDSGHVPAIVQASHANLILSTVLCHVAKARTTGWSQAAVMENQDHIDRAGFFESVFPYWMDRSTAISNTFDLEGMWILTAPNMAGKSTILRSTAAAALLSVCGLAAPLGSNSKLRRFDHLFVRGASADIPAEQKSAFGAEMGDVAALLRSCGAKSLVFVDELGRGTSPKDGTRLAGAVLEEMAQAGMSGMFATHLHDILNLPLSGRDRIRTKQMAIHEHDDAGKEVSQYSWTYRIEDGVCTDSMALITASRFGLPSKVLERATYFERFLGGSDSEVRQPLEERATTTDTSISRDRADGLDNGPNAEVLGLEKARRIVESITGGSAVLIPSTWSAPPALEGRSCVYVLQLKDPLCYYVGETDKLRQRLSQHRAKGERWSQCDAIAVAIAGGKSEARSVESRTIQSLAQAGFDLQSTSDGRAIRPSTLFP